MALGRTRRPLVKLIESAVYLPNRKKPLPESPEPECSLSRVVATTLSIPCNAARMRAVPNREADMVVEISEMLDFVKGWQAISDASDHGKT